MGTGCQALEDIWIDTEKFDIVQYKRNCHKATNVNLFYKIEFLCLVAASSVYNLDCRKLQFTIFTIFFLNLFHVLEEMDSGLNNFIQM